VIHVYTVRNLYPCRSVVNCSNEMVLSIRYSIIENKEAARIEYLAIRATSLVSIVVYLQREQRVFYISHYYFTEIDHFHHCSVAENTTDQLMNWYFSSVVVSSWKGLTFIIRVFFHAISWNIFLKGLICLTLIFIWNV
jgi:hypothetical protein